MNILVIGRGGREHAIAWKLAQSPSSTRVYVAPGNLGMGWGRHDITPIDIEENNSRQLIQFARAYHIRLVVIGPETALLDGLADDFTAAGISVFAPSREAALIEGSKQFAKDLMKEHHIPTAGYELFSDYESALAYVRKKGFPVVVKYDGLAAGKGVVVAQDLKEAETALAEMLEERKFGNSQVIIEEFLEGPEFSLMTMAHDGIVVPLAIAQDHKRVHENDQGPNTGGMGAYSPVPMIPEKAVRTALDTIMIPAVEALRKAGRPFTGILYGGLILTSDGPKVIEFNARFGDPETEVVLPKMKSDLLQHILDILSGKKPEIEWHDDYFLGVVMASEGYPASSSKGALIQGLEQAEGLVFHMGTQWDVGAWKTNGGRVLCVVGKGKTLEEARRDAYASVDRISCEKLFFRKDLGAKAI